jgi:hypothetical protein
MISMKPSKESGEVLHQIVYSNMRLGMWNMELWVYNNQEGF